MRDLDVIIPHLDRPSVAQTVASVLEASPYVRTVIVCDGGSRAPGAVQALRDISRYENVEVRSAPHPRFNKPFLLNTAFRHTRSPHLLVSDADILWSAGAIDALREAARGGSVCHVERVEETVPESGAAARPRYAAEVIPGEQGLPWRLRIGRDRVGGPSRPGYGLVAAPRAAWEALGGYNETLNGWGWEDVDFLVRARLLGFRVGSAAMATHVSHPNTARGTREAESLVASRNANIRKSCTAIASGVLTGSLVEPRVGGPTVVVETPQELAWEAPGAER